MNFKKLLFKPHSLNSLFDPPTYKYLKHFKIRNISNTFSYFIHKSKQRHKHIQSKTTVSSYITKRSMLNYNLALGYWSMSNLWIEFVFYFCVPQNIFAISFLLPIVVIIVVIVVIAISLASKYDCWYNVVIITPLPQK